MAETTELRIAGMDCAECAAHVEHAVKRIPGVAKIETYPMSLKAKVEYDPNRASLDTITGAIEKAGYSILPQDRLETAGEGALLGQRLGFALAGVFALILIIVIGGEATGLFDRVQDFVPRWVGAAIVIAAGGTIFWKVLRNAAQLRATSHTLMSIGALAALAVGAWLTSLIVVAFMRIGEAVEGYTTDKARDALRTLTRMSPQTARILRTTKTGGALGMLREEEVEVPVGEVKVGDVCVVRPGERVPVDGIVLEGAATIDQSAITGESMPVEAAAGGGVRAASIVSLGSLRVRAERVGEDTTFGRIIKLVEHTEAHRADVQRFADKFTNYFLPLVAGVALVTFLVTRDVLNAAAVLVIACSCSVALATPVAVLATTGASAKRGVLVKGGKHLERLAKADVLLVDKTGTLTYGKPRVTDIVPLDELAPDDILRLVASAERDSEHPLALAIRAMAKERSLDLAKPTSFRTMPGIGLEAIVDGRRVAVGNGRLAPALDEHPDAHRLARAGKTVAHVLIDDDHAAIIALQDTPRPEAKAALSALRERHAIKHIQILTGDSEETAAAIAGQLGVGYRARLLPEDKIRVVREHQAAGRVVVMVGDGVNDAPALAQADVGIAMRGGTDVAMDAAHVVLMRDDWTLIPEAFARAKRTMGIIRGNLVFTAVFNLAGMGLAATGVIPLVFAAAAQSIPDVGIMANSARLLKDKTEKGAYLA